MLFQPGLPAYAERQCITDFSFLRGPSNGEDLATRAAQLRYSTLVITDECSLAGVVRTHAALGAVVISYKARSVPHGVGKPLGVDLGIVDQVAKSHCGWDGKSDLAERVIECGMDPQSPIARHWTEIWQTEGRVRHLVVKRLVDLTPLLGRLATNSRDFA